MVDSMRRRPADLTHKQGDCCTLLHNRTIDRKQFPVRACSFLYSSISKDSQTSLSYDDPTIAAPLVRLGLLPWLAALVHLQPGHCHRLMRLTSPSTLQHGSPQS